MSDEDRDVLVADDLDESKILALYGEHDDVKEIMNRLMQFHPAYAEVGKAGMIWLAQAAIFNGANPLPGAGELHIWKNNRTGKVQHCFGIPYYRRKARQLGGLRWDVQPRPMSAEQATEYGVPDHEIGAICSAVRADDMRECIRDGLTVNDAYRMCGAVGYGTVNRQDQPKNGRTLNWTAEKRAEVDVYRKLFPDLMMPIGSDPDWREQLPPMRESLTSAQIQAQLRHGVKLLRGDHDEDDPLGLDTPIIRGSEEPRAPAVAVIDVDPTTGEVMGGLCGTPLFETEQSEQAQAEPEPEPDMVAPMDANEDDIIAFRLRVNKATKNFFADDSQLIQALRLQTGKRGLTWNQALNDPRSFTYALQFVHAHQKGDRS